MSRYFTMRYPWDIDRLDALAAQWATVRPDLEDIEVMAVIAR